MFNGKLQFASNNYISVSYQWPSLSILSYTNGQNINRVLNYLMLCAYRGNLWMCSLFFYLSHVHSGLRVSSCTWNWQVCANFEFWTSYIKVWEWLINPKNYLFVIPRFLCSSVSFPISYDKFPQKWIKMFMPSLRNRQIPKRFNSRQKSIDCTSVTEHLEPLV